MDKPQEVEKKIGQLQNRQKILLNRKRSEEHRARTHRLIGRGAILEDWTVKNCRKKAPPSSVGYWPRRKVTDAQRVSLSGGGARGLGSAPKPSEDFVEQKAH